MAMAAPTNEGMEHITFENLEREGHIPLAFHADPETRPFQPYTSGPFPRPPAKSSSTLRRWRQRASTRFPASTLRPNRAGAIAAKQYPARTAGPQERQLHELDLRQSARPSQDGSADQSADSRSIPHDAQSRGVADGDRVRVFNDRGSMELTAMLNAEPSRRRRGGAPRLGEVHSGRRQRECSHQRTPDRHRRAARRFIQRLWKWRKL